MPSPSPMTPEGCRKRASIAWWLRKDCFERQLGKLCVQCKTGSRRPKCWQQTECRWSGDGKERLRRWWLCAKGIPCRIRKNTKKNKRIFNNCVLLSWPSSMDSSSSNSRILTALPMDSSWKKWTKPVKYYWQWFAFKTVDLYPKIFTKGKVVLIDYSTPQKDQSITASFLLTIKVTL